MKADKKPPAGEIRKREHAAFMLPVAGALLIVPPLVTLFSGPYRIFGAPLQTVYLFATWMAMIVGAALLCRFMPSSGVIEHDNEDKGDG